MAVRVVRRAPQTIEEPQLQPPARELHTQKQPATHVAPARESLQTYCQSRAGTSAVERIGRSTEFSLWERVDPNDDGLG